MNKTRLKKILSSSMWLFWGLVFSPLKISGLIKINYPYNEFKNLKSPVIIASNHRHPLDPFTIGVALFPFLIIRFLPMTPYAAPLHRLQKLGQRIAKKIGFLQIVYFIFNVTYIPEAATFSGKVAPLIAAIKNGQSVLIFPEGRVYKKSQTQIFKNGVAELHLKTDVVIVPCAIHYFKTKFFYKTVVSLGTPIKIPRSIYDQDGLDGTAELIRNEVDLLYRQIIRSVH